jgi:hypothetical protein
VSDWKVTRWPSDEEEYYKEITAEMFESFLFRVFENVPETMHDDALTAAYSVFFYHMRHMQDEMFKRGLTIEDQNGKQQALICFPPGVRLPQGFVRDNPKDYQRRQNKERLN